MTKRKAERILYEVPLKRCIRSYTTRGDAGTSSDDITKDRTLCSNRGNPDLVKHSTRKRKMTHEENERGEDGPSCKSWNKKEPNENEKDLSQTQSRVVELNSGTFYADGQHVAASAGVTGQRNTNKRSEMHDWKPKLDMTTPSEKELCHFNTFQYWRVPLPDVDLSELQDPAAEGNRLADQTSTERTHIEMET
ncbi:uncharacterized protein wu:fa19b12 [Polyodon spathula]|uniref:uncharacterized protein wu:fa19b12 n=1 Tax=Polyodon spathula TaxID=7913 RepID=UPI001B7DA657|nr:uncharacterized protein wu:fa19b12 [Polyodon spathula]